MEEEQPFVPWADSKDEGGEEGEVEEEEEEEEEQDVWNNEFIGDADDEKYLNSLSALEREQVLAHRFEIRAESKSECFLQEQSAFFLFFFFSHFFFLQERKLAKARISNRKKSAREKSTKEKKTGRSSTKSTSRQAAKKRELEDKYNDSDDEYEDEVKIRSRNPYGEESTKRRAIKQEEEEDLQELREPATLADVIFFFFFFFFFFLLLVFCFIYIRGYSRFDCSDRRFSSGRKSPFSKRRRLADWCG
jgi:hypothetical protein